MTHFHSGLAEGMASDFRKVLIELNEKHDLLTQDQRNQIRHELGIAIGGFTNEGALDTQVVRGLVMAKLVLESVG